MPSEAAKRVARAIYDAAGLWTFEDHGVGSRVLPTFNLEQAERIIDAEFAREPARLQSQDVFASIISGIVDDLFPHVVNEAIKRAISAPEDCEYNSVHARSDATIRDISNVVGRRLTLQPCGHLVTSLRSTDEGTHHCEQCELEGEIADVLIIYRDELRSRKSIDDQADITAASRIDALLAKICPADGKHEEK